MKENVESALFAITVNNATTDENVASAVYKLLSQGEIAVGTKVYVTNNEYLFKTSDCNRDVTPNAELYNSIKENGWWELMPLIVMPEIDRRTNQLFFRIIDGHHRMNERLRVLADLRASGHTNVDIPIPFMICNPSNIHQMIAILNNTQRKWKTKDWLKFWLHYYTTYNEPLKARPFKMLLSLIDEFCDPNVKTKPYGNFLAILTKGKTTAKMIEKGFIQGVDEEFFRSIMGIFKTAKDITPEFPSGKTEFIKCVVKFMDRVYPTLTTTMQRNFLHRLMRCSIEKNSIDTYTDFFMWSGVRGKQEAITKAQQLKKFHNKN